MIAFDEAIRNADSANELRLNIKLNGRVQQGEPLSLAQEQKKDDAEAA